MNKNRRAPMGMGRGRGNNEKAKDVRKWSLLMIL